MPPDLDDLAPEHLASLTPDQLHRAADALATRYADKAPTLALLLRELIKRAESPTVDRAAAHQLVTRELREAGVQVVSMREAGRRIAGPVVVVMTAATPAVWGEGHTTLDALDMLQSDDPESFGKLIADN